MMRVLSFTAVVLSACVPVFAGDFEVEQWTFRWTLYERDETELELVKDQDTTKFSIDGGSFGAVWCTPDEAEELGAALAKTDDYYARLKDKTDAEETVMAGKFKVVFSTDPKLGFRVWVRGESRFGGSQLLERSDARGMAKKLVKAKAMAAWIDAKIKLD